MIFQNIFQKPFWLQPTKFGSARGAMAEDAKEGDPKEGEAAGESIGPGKKVAESGRPACGRDAELRKALKKAAFW